MTAKNNEMSEIEKLRQQLAETRVQLEVTKQLLDQMPPDVFFGEQAPTPAAPKSELVAEARAIKLAAAALVGLATRHMDTASYSVPEIQFERLVQMLYPPPLRAPADGGDGDNQ